MKLGSVKWFNNSKGYGFIRPDEGGEDLFVHFSYIEMEGYKTLKAGQAISYEETPSDKGVHATNIQSVGDNPNNTTDTDSSNESDTTMTDENLQLTLSLKLV